MKSIQGHFIADDGLINFDIGFIPDFIELYSALGGTELAFRFFSVLAKKAALSGAAYSGEYGIAISNTGAISVAASGSGFLTYEEGEDIGVMILHPGSGKLVASIVADWLAATNYNTGERSATAIGTIVRPPIHNGRVYELTTDTSTGDAEPSSWDVQPGETVQDGGANVWTCRKETVKKAGGMGFAVQSTIVSNGEIWVFRAVQDDRVVDFGDVDGFDPVTLPFN